MRPFSLNIRGRLIEYRRPAVMGIMNVTPDSFYAASRAFDEEAIERRIGQLIEEGADIIDVGAYSTRPGASSVGVGEEIDRLSRAMAILRRLAPDAVVSVDTFRARVAKVAVEDLGCDIVNDPSGCCLDEDMLHEVASLGVPYILTHTRSTPDEMHPQSHYDDVAAEVLRELAEQLRKLSEEGVCDVIVDPGIGFAKTLEQNYRLLENLSILGALHCPVLVGVSRKSLLTCLLDVHADEVLPETSALHAFCLDRGADILRVHDVAAAHRCIAVYEALTNGSYIPNAK